MSAGCPGRRKTAAPKVVEEAPRSPKRLQRGAQFTVFVYWDLRRYHEDLVGGSEHLDYFSTYIYIYIDIGNNGPKWLSYFFRGVGVPPTSDDDEEEEDQ